MLATVLVLGFFSHLDQEVCLPVGQFFHVLLSCSNVLPKHYCHAIIFRNKFEIFRFYHANMKLNFVSTCMLYIFMLLTWAIEKRNQLKPTNVKNYYTAMSFQWSVVKCMGKTMPGLNGKYFCNVNITGTYSFFY